MFNVQEATIRLPEPGEALLAAAHAKEAMPFLRERLDDDPSNARHWSNMAVAHRHLGNYPEALNCINEAILINPSTWEFFQNRGKIYEDLGRFDRALEEYIHAHKLNPASEKPRIAVTLGLMREKRFEEAWPCWQECHPCAFAEGVPPYNGEPLQGKRLLVTRNGGYGDTFWLLRYLKPLKLRGAHITFYGWKNQRQLLIGHSWIDRWADADDSLDEKDFDYQIPLMMLMPVIGVVPYPMLHGPYIRSTPKYFQEPNRNVIGLCWSAAEVYQARKIRSIPMEVLEPLRQVNARFVSLQPGTCPDWVEPLEGIDQGFHVTARAIAGLDLVVSVDSAVLHLAGAMETPAWGILPVGSDWKWFHEQERTAWYPRVRLFRSTDPVDMGEVVQRVASVLMDLDKEAMGVAVAE